MIQEGSYFYPPNCICWQFLCPCGQMLASFAQFQPVGLLHLGGHVCIWEYNSHFSVLQLLNWREPWLCSERIRICIVSVQHWKTAYGWGLGVVLTSICSYRQAFKSILVWRCLLHWFLPLVNVWKKVFTECDSVTVSQYFGFGSRISLRNSLLSPAFAAQVTDLSVVPIQLFVKECDALDKWHNSG